MDENQNQNEQQMNNTDTPDNVNVMGNNPFGAGGKGEHSELGYLVWILVVVVAVLAVWLFFFRADGNLNNVVNLNDLEKEPIVIIYERTEIVNPELASVGPRLVVVSLEEQRRVTALQNEIIEGLNLEDGDVIDEDALAEFPQVVTLGCTMEEFEENRFVCPVPIPLFGTLSQDGAEYEIWVADSARSLNSRDGSSLVANNIFIEGQKLDSRERGKGQYGLF